MKYDITIEYRNRLGQSKSVVETVDVDTWEEAQQANHERLTAFAEAHPKARHLSATPRPRT